MSFILTYYKNGDYYYCFYLFFIIPAIYINRIGEAASEVLCAHLVGDKSTYDFGAVGPRALIKR